MTTVETSLTKLETPKFDFVVFYVANAAKALAQFEQMGFLRVPEGDGPNFYQLRGLAEMPQFGLAQVNSDGPQAGEIGIYFRVNDLVTHREALAKQGINPGSIEEQPFGNIFPVPDADGFQLYMLG